MTGRRRLSRRLFLAGLAVGGPGGRAFAQAAPAIVTAERERPLLPSGIMSGDVGRGRAVLWARTDRPARMIVELAGDERFRRVLRRIEGPAALEEDDFTAKLQLDGLPEGERLHYRIRFADLAEPRLESAPLAGSFRTGGGGQRPLAFTFAGDEGGQGWGINPEFGGYRLYEAMRRAEPDFFIHSGDQIYADAPIPAERRLGDGRIWRNLVTEAKSRPAQSLADFRGAYAYNLMDENKRRFAAEVPFLVQWDDHEVRNNWWPGQMLDDPRYEVKCVSLLAARAKRAMFEWNPIRSDPRDPERVYRAFSFGPLLDVLMLDERSYRGPNSPNRQRERGADADFLGPAQMRWLKSRLLRSTATWKVIASDMPLSLVNEDNQRGAPPGTYEAWPNADDGPPLGRELEIAELLRFAQENRIRNLVFLTADVHFAAAYRYDPGRAALAAFDPFWEFVAGPISASTFGPNALDMTFGPEEKFLAVPRGMQGGRSPFDGLQFFGLGRIDPATEVLTVSLHDIDGRELYKVPLEPQIG